MDRIGRLQPLIDSLKADNPDIQAIEICGDYLYGFKNRIPHDIDVAVTSTRRYNQTIDEPMDVSVPFDEYERTPGKVHVVEYGESDYRSLEWGLDWPLTFTRQVNRILLLTGNALRSVTVDGSSYFDISNPPPLEYMMAKVEELIRDVNQELSSANSLVHSVENLIMYRNYKALERTPQETAAVTEFLRSFENQEKQRLYYQNKAIRRLYEAQLTIKLLCELYDLDSTNILPSTSDNPYIGERAFETLSTYITEGIPYQSYIIDGIHNTMHFAEPANASWEISEAVNSLNERIRIKTFKQLVEPAIEPKKDPNAVPRRIVLPDGRSMEVTLELLINYLSSEDPAERLAAAQVLGNIRDPQAIQPLLGLIQREITTPVPESDAIIAAATQTLNSISQEGTFLEYGIYDVSQAVLDEINQLLGIAEEYPKELVLSNSIMLRSLDHPDYTGLDDNEKNVLITAATLHGMEHIVTTEAGTELDSARLKLEQTEATPINIGGTDYYERINALRKVVGYEGTSRDNTAVLKEGLALLAKLEFLEDKYDADFATKFPAEAQKLQDINDIFDMRYEETQITEPGSGVITTVRHWVSQISEVQTLFSKIQSVTIENELLLKSGVVFAIASHNLDELHTLNPVWQQGRTVLIEDADPAYYIAYKFADKDDIDGSVLRDERKVMLEAQERNMQNAPEVLREVFQFEGDISNLPAVINPSRYVLKYRCKKSARQSITEEFTDIIDPDPVVQRTMRKDALKQFAKKNIQDYLEFFKNGYIHTSLTPLTHSVSSGRQWFWNAMPIGFIMNLREKMRHSNMRRTGLADFEHIIKMGGYFDCSLYLGQMLSEVTLAVTYSGLNNGLSPAEIKDVLSTLYRDFLGTLGVSDEIVDSISSNLDNFIAKFAAHAEYNEIHTEPLNFLKEVIKPIVDAAGDSPYVKYRMPINNTLVGESPFDDVADILRDSEDNKYVLDKDHVHIFDGTDNFITSFEHHSNKPSRMSIDSDGELYILDEDFVKIFTNSGQPITLFRHNCSSVSGIAVNSEDKIYITDSDKNRVHVFQRDGNLLNSFGPVIGAGGQLYHPRGIAIDSEDNVLIADEVNHRIVVFNKDGNFIESLGTKGISRGQFSSPFAVTIDPHGNIWVLDFHRVHMFDRDYRLIKSFDAEPEFMSGFSAVTSGVEVDSKSNIYITSQLHNRVRIIKPQAIEYLIVCLSSPYPTERLVAAQVLGERGEPQAVQPLLNLIASETDPDVLNAAIQALNSIGISSEESIPLEKGVYRASQEYGMTLQFILTAHPA
jgi:sugar lactone lactonase YvrE